MTKITKTTINMATRRGLDLIFFDDNAVILLNIAPLDSDSDAGVYYRVTDGGLFFDSATVNSEDWPRWIATDSKLRAYLGDMAAALT